MYYFKYSLLLFDSVPPENILRQFLELCNLHLESDGNGPKGAIAIHCKAGLGRTGTLIAAWMMKKYRFTAAEAIAWCRVARPGSVIGPQQHYLEQKQQALWNLGAASQGAANQVLCDAEQLKKLDDENARMINMTQGDYLNQIKASRAHWHSNSVSDDVECSESESRHLHLHHHHNHHHHHHKASHSQAPRNSNQPKPYSGVSALASQNAVRNRSGSGSQSGASRATRKGGNAVASSSSASFTTANQTGGNPRRLDYQQRSSSNQPATLASSSTTRRYQQQQTNLPVPGQSPSYQRSATMIADRRITRSQAAAAAASVLVPSNNQKSVTSRFGSLTQEA